MATKRQREQAARILMRAIYTLEAAQHAASVRACEAAGLVDQSRINQAKELVHMVAKRVEGE